MRKISRKCQARGIGKKKNIKEYRTKISIGVETKGESVREGSIGRYIERGIEREEIDEERDN